MGVHPGPFRTELSSVRLPARLHLRDGVPYVVADAITDQELAAPLSWWQRHLLAFRAIDSGLGRDICRW